MENDMYNGEWSSWSYTVQKPQATHYLVLSQLTVMSLSCLEEVTANGT